MFQQECLKIKVSDLINIKRKPMRKLSTHSGRKTEYSFASRTNRLCRSLSGVG